MNLQLPEYIIIPDNGELGANGFLKLQGYHELLCSVLEQDNATTGHSISETLRSGFAWAIISISMEVLEPVSSCQPLRGQTWVSSAEYPYTRRETSVYSSDGKELFRASIYMVPLDTEQHKILPEILLPPAPAPLPYGETVAWAVPRMRDNGEFAPVHSREIYPSDIDALGHLNNCRYGSFTFDAAAIEGFDFTDRSFCYSVNFIRQYLPSDRPEISFRSDENGFHVCGALSGSRKKNFVSSLKIIQ